MFSTPTITKIQRYLFAVALALEFFSLPAIAVKERCPEKYGELSRRSYVRKVDPLNETNGFQTSRDLWEYSSILTKSNNGRYDTATKVRSGENLLSVIKRLPEKSVWIDMGSGEGFALDDGLKLNKKLNGIGVAFREVDPPHYSSGFAYNVHMELLARQKALQKEGRLKLFYGKPVENLAGKLDPWKNKTQLITDLYGPLSYTYDFPRVLQAYVDLLEKDGVLFFTPPPITIHLRDGKKMDLMKWLKKIPGVSVKKTLGANGVKLIKQRGKIKVPQNLKLKVEGGGLPPRGNTK